DSSATLTYTHALHAALPIWLRSRPLCPDACSEPESARAQCDRAESDRPERCELAQVDRSACDAEEHHVCRHTGRLDGLDQRLAVDGTDVLHEEAGREHEEHVLDVEHVRQLVAEEDHEDDEDDEPGAD